MSMEATTTKVRERPILFSAPMVRVLLAGRKTQTRRIIKPAWWRCLDSEDADDRAAALAMCPYGQPGDLLFVRETLLVTEDDVMYAADETVIAMDAMVALYGGFSFRIGKVPSIHMPRVFSRILLQITDVRIQRLHEIDEHDADREGFVSFKSTSEGDGPSTTARGNFKRLWHKINGEKSWDENPWVWAISFERVTA